MQTLALQITAVLMLVILGGFAWVVINSGKPLPYDDVSVPAYHLRGRLFAGSIIAGVVVAYFTLIPWPHDAGAAEVARHVDARAFQWRWELSDQTAKVGETIEFRVSSEDVNHGFALYDPEERLVAQIQAMPGFTNKVRYRFTQPGVHKILCLEYCGLAHHGMVAQIDVQPAEAAR